VKVTVLLVILYVLVCLFLILVVLLQQGKGADLAGAFGGGGSQTSFGPRTRTNVMHRLTTVSFILFVMLSITLAILSGKRGGSVMESVAASEAAATPAATAPAAPATGATTGEPAVTAEEEAGGGTQEAAPEEAGSGTDADDAGTSR
jgi:preprotein translocase subunit SecG